MWKYFGVLCNTLTVLLGAGFGLFLRSRAGKCPAADGKRTEKLPPREDLSTVMMVCLGFCTISAAVGGLIGVENGEQALVVVVSMVVGFLIGWALRIDDRLNLLGDKLLEKVTHGKAAGAKNPAEGFVTACLLFCIGSMTILGAFESAANPAGALDLDCHTTYLIKSLLDLCSSVCLTVTFGISVLASAAFVLVFQGLLVMLAATIQPFLAQINAMPAINCVGSLIILAIALNIMGIKKIKTADYLPALFLPILICWLTSL